MPIKSAHAHADDRNMYAAQRLVVCLMCCNWTRELKERAVYEYKDRVYKTIMLQGGGVRAKTNG